MQLGGLQNGNFCRLRKLNFPTTSRCYSACQSRQFWPPPGPQPCTRVPSRGLGWELLEGLSRGQLGAFNLSEPAIEGMQSRPAYASFVEQTSLSQEPRWKSGAARSFSLLSAPSSMLRSKSRRHTTNSKPSVNRLEIYWTLPSISMIRCETSALCGVKSLLCSQRRKKNGSIARSATQRRRSVMWLDSLNPRGSTCRLLRVPRTSDSRTESCSF